MNFFKNLKHFNSYFISSRIFCTFLLFLNEIGREGEIQVGVLWLILKDAVKSYQLYQFDPFSFDRVYQRFRQT